MVLHLMEKQFGGVTKKDERETLSGLAAITSAVLVMSSSFKMILLELPILKNSTLQILKQKFCLIIMQQ